MADSAFHVLSLCSGTAMLDEGVRVAVPEARTVGYVEREAFAQGILLARMGDAALEPAPVWCGPLEDFPSGEWRGAVDCITAGFPCQPWSAAGKQQGEADERWLWPAIAGIIRAVEPSLVFLENVPGLVAGRGINRVLGDLAALGFDAEWCSISAADVGAAHLRERVFILAVDTRGGRRVLRESSERRERFADGCDAELAVSLVCGRVEGDRCGPYRAGSSPRGGRLAGDAASSRLAGRQNSGADCGDARTNGSRRLELGGPREAITSLQVLAQVWPTPNSHPASSLPVLAIPDGRKSSVPSRGSRRRLNPAFAAWLMGMPWWWTSTERINSAQSEIALWRCRLASRSRFLLGGS